MIKYLRKDAGFLTEVPDEISLVYSITGCQGTCDGCHSPMLRKDVGEELTFQEIKSDIEYYGKDITNICFFGGEWEGIDFINIIDFIKRNSDYKISLYSGLDTMIKEIEPYLDYYKIGPYIEKYGGLESKTTNQRMYKKYKNEWYNITHRFW